MNAARFKPGDEIEIRCASCNGTGDGDDPADPAKKCRWCYGSGTNKHKLTPHEAVLAETVRGETRTEIAAEFREQIRILEEQTKPAQSDTSKARRHGIRIALETNAEILEEKEVFGPAPGRGSADA